MEGPDGDQAVMRDPTNSEVLLIHSLPKTDFV